MPRKLELIGQRFGRWSVLEEAGRNKWGNILWKCCCDCGIKKYVLGSDLGKGRTKSCGCLNIEKLTKLSRLRVGKKHHMFGRKRPEHSDRMKAENNPMFGVHRFGKKNPAWNFNLTDEERQDGRMYTEYYEWRAAVYERDSYTCKCCEDNKGGNLCAHHLESYRDNPELRTTLENGITLCEKCHKRFHNQYGYGNNNRKQFYDFLCVRKILL